MPAKGCDECRRNFRVGWRASGGNGVSHGPVHSPRRPRSSRGSLGKLTEQLGRFPLPNAAQLRPETIIHTFTHLHTQQLQNRRTTFSLCQTLIYILVASRAEHEWPSLLFPTVFHIFRAPRTMKAVVKLCQPNLAATVRTHRRCHSGWSS